MQFGGYCHKRFDLTQLHTLTVPRQAGGRPDEVHPVLQLADPAISAALHAIHRDPAYHWTVQTLAVQVGLSRAAFAKRFTCQLMTAETLRLSVGCLLATG